MDGRGAAVGLLRPAEPGRAPLVFFVRPQGGWRMLILSRWDKESLLLEMPDGTKAVVKVVEIRGKKVRLGIDAPQAVRVVRSELLEREEPR